MAPVPRIILGMFAAIFFAIAPGPASAESAANSKAAISTSPSPNGPYEQETIHRSGTSSSQPTQVKAGTGNNFNSWDVRRVSISLAGVVVLIFAMRALGKKMIPGAVGSQSSRAVRVLVRSSVSARQQLLLVQVGRRLVLVGSGGAEMNPLCQIDDPDEVAEVLVQLREDKGPVARNFRSLFGKAEKAYEATDESSVESDEPRNVAAPVPEGLTGLTERVRRISEKFQ